MKIDSTISEGIQRIMKDAPEQKNFYTIEQELTFEERYPPEIRKQLQHVDVEVIIQSCSAKIIFRKNDNDKNINK